MFVKYISLLVMIAFLFRHRLIRIIIKWPQIKCIYTNFIFGFYHFSPAGRYNFALYVATFIWIMFLKCMYHEKLNNEKLTNYETQIFNKTFSKFRSLKLKVKTEYNLGDYYFCLFKKANTSKMQGFYWNKTSSRG